MNTTELMNQALALRAKAARIEELARKRQEIEEELRDITGVDRVAVPFPMSFNKEEKPNPPVGTPRRHYNIHTNSRAAKVDDVILKYLSDGFGRHHKAILDEVDANIDFVLPASGIRNRLNLLKKRGKIESCGVGFYRIASSTRHEQNT